MEVRIRMQKVGQNSKKRFNYRVVVMGRSQSRQSRNLDILGHYDPAKQPAVFVINREKLDKWLKQGARMSDTVRTLVKKSAK